VPVPVPEKRTAKPYRHSATCARELPRGDPQNLPEREEGRAGTGTGTGTGSKILERQG